MDVAEADEWALENLKRIREIFGEKLMPPFFILLVCSKHPLTGALLNESMVLPITGNPVDSVYEHARKFAQVTAAPVALQIGTTRSGEKQAVLVIREHVSGFRSWVAPINDGQVGEFTETSQCAHQRVLPQFN